MHDLPNEYTGGATSRAGRLRQGASETLRSAKAGVSAAYDRTADEATRAYHGARGYAQSHPGVAGATVFAAGLGVGILIGARGAARAYRRGFVPAVAFALAQAVRDVVDRLR